MSLEDDWNLLCQKTHKFVADGNVKVCSIMVSELVAGEVETFCQQGVPETEEEMNARRRQVVDLTGRASLISHAAWMARARVEVGERIFDLVRECFRAPLAKDDIENERSGKLRAEVRETITRLCRNGPEEEKEVS
jgi:hypothetical protein